MHYTVFAFQICLSTFVIQLRYMVEIWDNKFIYLLIFSLIRLILRSPELITTISQHQLIKIQWHTLILFNAIK